MGFLISMLIIGLMIPVIMIIGGWAMWKHCPKHINGLVGYRTTRSTSSIEAWEFAHERCGKLWYKVGWLVFGISAVIVLITIGAALLGWVPEFVAILIGSILCLAQCIILVATIPVVERALREKFSE